MTSEQAESGIGAGFERLVSIMARLRGPEGCPWDREQTHRTLRRHALEEVYEVLEAIDAGDPKELCSELGDLLLQVVFHAQLSAEAGEFGIAEVVRGLVDKLITRHPHVFGDLEIDTAAGVLEEWERIKAREREQAIEKRPASGLAVPRDLPALARAEAVLRKAARAGIARSADEIGEALEGALARLSGDDEAGAEEALGEILFAVADLARANGVEAEQALRERVNRFLAGVRGQGSGDRE